MLKLLVFRDQLKALYGRGSYILTPLFRFVLAMVSMILLNQSLGYMKTLKSPALLLALALISAVCPYGGVCWILAFFMLAHIFAVSLELTLITAAFLLVVALLYYGFAPGDSYLLIITPLLFAMKLPSAAPLLVGLGCSLVSVIPMSCGVVIYYILRYVHLNAGPLTNGDSVDITQRVVQMINGILLDRTMLMYLIAFAVTAISVGLIRRLSMDHAWSAAIVAGVLILLTSYFLGMSLYSVNLEPVPLFAGTAAGAALAALFQFFVFSVDYSRTEYTQFEDDDYYYYVKAVPKLAVTRPEPKVQKISSARRSRRQRETAGRDSLRKDDGGPSAGFQGNMRSGG